VLVLPDFMIEPHVASGALVRSSPTTREDIKRFASEFDPQPFHLDETPAERTPLKGLAFDWLNERGYRGIDWVIDGDTSRTCCDWFL
jgi:hypothetical protein